MDQSHFAKAKEAIVSAVDGLVSPKISQQQVTRDLFMFIALEENTSLVLQESFSNFLWKAGKLHLFLSLDFFI